VPDHAVLLYLLLPLACLTAVTVLMLPGIFFVLALGRDDRIEAVVVKGFGVSLVVHFVTTALAKTLFPPPITTATFLALIIGAGVVAWGTLLARLRRPGGLRWPERDGIAYRRLGWMAALVAVTVAVFLPIFFWQDLSPDGFEALEIGRSLSWTALPRFLTQGGLAGLGIGMLPMAYPVHWFIMLFGPIEAAARLPILLYLPILFMALAALIEFRSPRRLGGIEEAAIMLALAVYVVTMGYSASYDSYFADLSSPAAFETLTVTVMVAAASFLWSEQPGWFVGAAVLSYLARPTGLLFVLLLGLGLVLVAPERRRSIFILVAASVGVWGLLYVAYEVLLPSFADTTLEYSAGSIIDRFHYLRLDDWRRVIYVVVPGGLVPAVALLAVRQQDRIARSLTIAALGYFVVFYVPAFTNLHHFVPAMILPIVVFWRVALRRSSRRWLVGAAYAGGIVALIASLPRHFEIDRSMRQIGGAVAYRIGDYGSSRVSAHRESYRGRDLLHRLFAPDWEVADPSAELVGGMQLIYYATKAVQPGRTNYVVQPLSQPRPPGYSKLAEDEAAAVYINDLARWRQDRFRPRRVDYRSRIYEIPRETRAFYWGIPARNYTINLGALPVFWRLF
jgi:hypothetical protein